MQLPPTIEELRLVLENERVFYDNVAGVAELVNSATTYRRFRQRLYKTVRDLIPKYPAGTNGVTTKLARYFFICYAEPTIDTLREFDDFWSAEYKDHMSISDEKLEHKYLARPQTTEPTLIKENEMSLPQVSAPAANVPAVENKTFVFGADAKTMSDDVILSHIARIESEIKQLEDIKTPSKKITTMIDAKKADIAALVEVLDSRL